MLRRPFVPLALLVLAAGSVAGSVAGPAAAQAPKRYTEADVRFMQGMIHHHAQALVMAALVPSRTRRDDMRLLAERITVSQRDEIALMQSWLRRHGEPVPDSTGAMPMDHSSMSMPGMTMDSTSMGMASMPGMATQAQLDSLASLDGPAFDRLFLDLMVRHHEGALKMVATLFGTRGAARDPEVFRFASDVDADQRAEIARMRTLRAALP